jgi:hypothetical protein
METESEKENDQWLRSTALSKALEYYEKRNLKEMFATPRDVLEVAADFYKFMKGE